MDALAAAAKAWESTPARRMIVTSVDAGKNETSVITMETVNPDSMHMKSESGGMTQIEVITDGNRVFMSHGGGKLTEAPAQMAAMMKQTRAQFSGDAMVKMAHNVKLAGHETINGVPASIYSFDSDMMGVHSDSREWISDSDHRPLKMEGTVTGNAKTGGKPGTGLDRKTSAVFEYDPSIKITLPAK